MVIETRTGSDFWVGARGQLFGGGDGGNILGCCKCPLSSLGRGLLGHMHMLRNIAMSIYTCVFRCMKLLVCYHKRIPQIRCLKQWKCIFSHFGKSKIKVPSELVFGEVFSWFVFCVLSCECSSVCLWRVRSGILFGLPR